MLRKLQLKYQLYRHIFKFPINIIDGIDSLGGFNL